MFPHARAYGVAGPGHDWRIARGEPGNDLACASGRRPRLGVAPEATITALDRALSDTHPTDAHCTAYVLYDSHGSPLSTQPRVNKSGLAFVRSLGFTVAIDTLIADVDNPGHCGWTPELRAQATLDDRRLATAGVYYTAHGRRIVQPLKRPIDVEHVEPVISGWLAFLETLGILADPSCRDWTRYMRLPNVRRDGRPYVSPLIDLDHMRPIDAPEPVTRGRWGRAAARAIGPMRPLSATPLADAFAAAGWITGSLGVDKSAVRCPWAANHSGRPPHGVDTSTVVFGASVKYPLGYFHCSHAHCAYRRQAEVIAALPPMARALLPAPDAPAPVGRVVLPSSETAGILQEAFRRAPDGLSLVIAGCGTGKTEAALVVARERAARLHATGGEHVRVPAHSRTAISVPSTQLSHELVERLRSEGASVRRVFGPLSLRRADGEPECRFHAAASAYANGGQSVPWDFCRGRDTEPCEHADTCRAFGGVDGPDDARITIGPHALLSQLDGAAGATGLLVIDEPPPLLEHVPITVSELLGAEAGLGPFEHRYAAAMRVSLRAIATWITRGPLDAPGPLSRAVEVTDAELLEDAFEATGEADAVACARAAHDPRHRGPKLPPVRRSEAFVARRSAGYAAKIGKVSRILQTVWLALTSAPGTTIARLTERPQRGDAPAERLLVVTLPDRQLHAAMRREGAVVIADANGRIHLPTYAAIMGYVPPTTEAHAADGARVQRTIIRARATRRAWMPRGRVVAEALGPAWRAAVEWACGLPAQSRGLPARPRTPSPCTCDPLSARHDKSESIQGFTCDSCASARRSQRRTTLDQSAPIGDTRRIAIVTLLPVELSLRAARGDDVTAKWIAAGQPVSTLPAVAATLRPGLDCLAAAGWRVDFGHFGALRGLDHWRGHDALMTLGDPWTDRDDAAWEAEYLRHPAWEQRYADLCAAELEQAHGRLRTVHRTTPAHALHVGAVLPGGWADASPPVEVREARRGPAPATGGMLAEDVRAAVSEAGGFEEALRCLSVSRRALANYLSGDRVIPPEVARDLLSLAALRGM